MELNDFIKKFASQFEETDAHLFAAKTNYKELDEWSSLLTLSIIAMVDEEYGIIIKGEDIRNSQTIAELFELVKSKK